MTRFQALALLRKSRTRTRPRFRIYKVSIVTFAFTRYFCNPGIFVCGITIGNRYPSFTDDKCGIQCLESGHHGVNTESKTVLDSLWHRAIDTSREDAWLGVQWPSNQCALYISHFIREADLWQGWGNGALWNQQTQWNQSTFHFNLLHFYGDYAVFLSSSIICIILLFA